MWKNIDADDMSIPTDGRKKLNNFDNIKTHIISGSLLKYMKYTCMHVISHIIAKYCLRRSNK